MLLSKISLAEDPTEIPRCSGVLFPPFVMSMISLDMVAGSGSSYLLIKPMLKMHKMEEELEKNSINDQVYSGSGKDAFEFKSIAKKQAILSGISVSTSWFTLIGVMLTNMHLVFVSLDLVISTMSVLLIYSWNQWIFDRLCCCCMGSKAKSPSENDVKNLEVAMEKSDAAQKRAESEIGDASTGMARIGSVSTHTNFKLQWILF